MTRLILAPFDLDAPGSYAVRNEMMNIIEQLSEAEKNNDGLAVIRLNRQAEAMIKPRLRTDDGSPVEEILKTISLRQFSELLQGFWITAPEENSVPPVSAAS